MYDTFILDLDGTLVTHEMNFMAFKKVLEKELMLHDYPHKEISWKKGFVDSFNYFIAEFEKVGIDGKKIIERLIQLIREYEIERASYTREIKGASDTLKYLKEKNYKIGIVTRNNSVAANISIKNAGLKKYIGVLVTRDDRNAMQQKTEQIALALNKLNSKAENTVVVGDYNFEILAGNKIGCMTIGVLTGAGDRSLLKDAALIIDTISDLKDYF